jgi:hypothetical protein
VIKFDGLMNSKKTISRELQSIKTQIQDLSVNNANIKDIISGKMKAEETSSGLLSIVRYLSDENRKTTLLLQSMADTMAKMESDLSADYEEGKSPMQEASKELPVSGLDARILQYIQVANMACADDLKKNMNYKGRNAASARLNRLYKQGLLERYQLGHKVYYKYDAGKAAKTLIVSPPQ